jgi:hypothetical protein
MILFTLIRRHDRRFLKESIIIVMATDIGQRSIKIIQKNVESIDDDDHNKR